MAGKMALAEVECARADDFSVLYQTRTHLGNVLKPGDLCYGCPLPRSLPPPLAPSLLLAPRDPVTPWPRDHRPSAI